MKAAKYLFVFWAGIFVYTSLSISFGATGLSAQRQLERELQKQEENIQVLMQINRELEDAMNSLLFDSETLAIHARNLGFASEQERFVRIVGLGVNQRNITNAGTVVIAAQPQYASNRTFRIIALSTGIMIFVSMIIFDVFDLYQKKLNRKIKEQI